MKNKKTLSLLLIDTLNLIVSFLVSRWIFMDFLYHYYLDIMTYSITRDDFYGPLIAILILTILLFSIFRFLYVQCISKKQIIFLYGLYFLVLFYSLFLKNIGIKGITLNPMDMVADILAGYTTVPLLNVLIFIPVGILTKQAPRKILYTTFLILCIELAQYTLSLGILDIGDILCNLAGVIIGSSITQTKLYGWLEKK